MAKPINLPIPKASASAVATIPLFASVVPNGDGGFRILPPRPPTGEITTKQAALIMGVSVDTMLRLQNDPKVGHVLKSRPFSGRPRSKRLWGLASVVAAREALAALDN